MNESTSNPLGTAKQNAIAANVKLNGIQAANKDAYKASTNAGTANQDVAQFSVLANGNIILNNDITASDILAHGSNIYKLQVEVKDIHNYVQTVDVQIKIDYAEPDFHFTDSLTVELPKNEMYHDGTTRVSNYDVVYAKNGTMDVYTNYLGTINYSVDAGGAQDVISQTQAQANSSQFTLDHATDLDVNGQSVADAYVKACRIQENGYKAKCIYTKVSVEKATQNLQFAANPLKIGKGTTGFTPIYTGHEDGVGVIITNTSNPSIVVGEGSTAGQTNDESLTTGITEGTAVLTAYAQGNRDYKEATATTTVEITNKPPATLVLKASPSSNISYGETNAKVEIIRNYDPSKPAYFWSDDDSIIKVIDSTTSDNVTTQLEINKVGSTIINVCQTVGYKPGDSCAEADFGYLQVSVSKASLTLKLSDKTIYTGETIPTYDFEPTPISGSFKGRDSITDFAIPASTRAVDGVITIGNSDKAGMYLIKGSYSTAEQATVIVENYNVSIQDGTLEIKEDKSANSWYHLEDDNGNILTSGSWFNHDVNVVLDPAQSTGNAGTYDTISSDKTTWSKPSFSVDKEDENSTDIFFQIDPLGGTTHAGAIADKQTTTIKIDKTNPTIKKITGATTNKDAISQLIHNLTFGAFFKPGTKISILSEDILPTPTTKVSGVEEVSYEVYEIDKTTGIVQATPKAQGVLTPDAKGTSEVTLQDTGLYRVCAIAKDNAGNVSVESCSDVNIKKIDVDIDGDGENEFKDPGNDGCPDINIPLLDKDGNIYKINVDRDGDGIPDLNIDSRGNSAGSPPDGIADINVDIDKDDKPDLNLVILDKWEPTLCVTNQSSEYCTMKDIKAEINIDTDNDGIPDLNIDTTGDMKADINIDRNNDGILDPKDLNITGEIKAWVPKTDYTKDEFLYDTQTDFIPKINIVTTDQMKPDINIDLTGDGLPDINIDINGDGIPDTNIDSTGDGEPDFNLDPDRTGTPQSNIIKITTWTPTLSGEKDGIGFNTMGDLKLNDVLTDDDSGSQIQKPGGGFLPNYSLKVDSIKDSIDQTDKEIIEDFVEGDTEIKDILDVKLSDGTSIIQPDGSVKVRIPISDELAESNTVKVVVEQADGTYKEVEATIKDGYLEYETDYLGKVGIIADKDIDADVTPTPTPEPGTDKPDVSIPDTKADTSVKGEYTSNIGGAGTGIGDEQQRFTYAIVLSILALGILSYYKKKV